MNKKLIAIILFLLLLFVGSFSVYADDTEITNDTENTSGESELTPEEVVLREAEKYLEEAREISAYNESILGVSASGTSGFHSVILGLLGDYEPIVKDYIYTSNNGYQQHSIEITPDYSWISGAAIFALVIICVFRLIGVVLSGVFK